MDLSAMELQRVTHTAEELLPGLAGGYSPLFCMRPGDISGVPGRRSRSAGLACQEPAVALPRVRRRPLASQLNRYRAADGLSTSRHWHAPRP
jgi:hypothetical protein